jgi:hypothetical protein
MTSNQQHPVQQSVVDDFLAGHRIAVVGASDDPKNFARTIYAELRSHGYEPVAVHPSAPTVDGDPAYPSLDAVPGDLDGVVVMVGADHATAVVSQCLDRGIDKIWLFQGLGGAGAVSEEALQACADAGVSVVPGACPLMFLEPVGWAHRVHRAARRHRHAVVVNAEPVT